MKHSLFFSLLLSTFFTASAQQLNSSSFYELHGVLHNPATAGAGGHTVAGASFKKQWSSMPGSPQTGFVYGQTYLAGAKVGLGGYLYHDVTGPTARTGLQMAYAYHIPVKEGATFSMGLEARLQQLRFDRAKLQAELGSNDPVATANSNRMKADAGFGLAYNSSTLRVGAAVSQMVQSKYRLYEAVGTTTEQSKLHRHYYLHANYTLKADEATSFIPNVLFIYLPNAPLEMQTGVRISHNNLFWYGVNWRARQGWMLSAGLKLKEKFGIGYSFEIYSTPASIYESGSSGHELQLQYQF